MGPASGLSRCHLSSGALGPFLGAAGLDLPALPCILLHDSGCVRNRSCTAKTREDPGQVLVGPGLATVAVRLRGHFGGDSPTGGLSATLVQAVLGASTWGTGGLLTCLHHPQGVASVTDLASVLLSLQIHMLETLPSM